MKNLYIDFDGVILDTITPVYNLAKKLNIHSTHYNRIENSYKTITIDTAIKLKQILNYKEDDLFENL